MRRLTILDEDMNDLFEREMRIYLLKTEEEFSQLALEKYTEEIKAKNKEDRMKNKKKSTTDGAQSSTKEQTGESFPKNLVPTQNKSMHQQHGTSALLPEQPLLSNTMINSQQHDQSDGNMLSFIENISQTSDSSSLQIRAAALDEGDISPASQNRDHSQPGSKLLLPLNNQGRKDDKSLSKNSAAFLLKRDKSNNKKNALVAA